MPMTLVSVTRRLCYTSTSSACRVEVNIGCCRVCCPLLFGRAVVETAGSGSHTRKGDRFTRTGSCAVTRIGICSNDIEEGGHTG